MSNELSFTTGDAETSRFTRSGKGRFNRAVRKYATKVLLALALVTTFDPAGRPITATRR